MPAGGGPKAAHEIRTRSPHTRVLALSAFEDRGAAFQMLCAGASGYLVKGAGVEEILGAIHGAVRGRGALSTGVAADVIDQLAGQLVRDEAESQAERERIGCIQRVLKGEGLTSAFQPIMHLRTGDTVGVEALSRFSLEPQRGPGVWFAEAWEVGLGIDLELAAVRSTLRHLKDLPPGVWLSMNVSPETARSVRLRDLLEGS